MVKQAKGGLPYLHVPLKFNTASTDVLETNLDLFLNKLNEVISEIIVAPSPAVGPRGHEFKNDIASVGLQPVIDELPKGTIEFALFDSQAFLPTGVGNAICLLIVNCPHSKCYSIPGLKDMLSALGVTAEAIGFSKRGDKVSKVIQESGAVVIGFDTEKNKPVKTALVSPILTKSIGKGNKKKKNKNKK